MGVLLLFVAFYKMIKAKCKHRGLTDKMMDALSIFGLRVVAVRPTDLVDVGGFCLLGF